MGYRLEYPNSSGGTTNHQADIEVLSYGLAFVREEQMRRCLRLAIELLEAHDASGISLDNWDAAREFVEALTGQEITPNGI